MKPEIKKKWLSALRSGEYKQGIRKLRNNKDNFCCLGVLCDLHSKETESVWVRNATDFSYIECRDTLPKLVKDWAGLNSAVTVLLSLMNDGIYCSNSEMTFSEIADYIEKEL